MLHTLEHWPSLHRNPMTFWEQYKLHLSKKWIPTLWIVASTILVPVGIKLLTGSHYILDIQLKYLTIPRYLVCSWVGACIGFLIISAVQVYLNRKYDCNDLP